MLATPTPMTQHDTDYHWQDNEVEDDEYTITNEQRLAQLELEAIARNRTAELSKQQNYIHSPDSGIERLRYVNEALRNDPTPIESDRIRKVVFRDSNLAEIRYVEPLVYDTDTDDDGYEELQDVVYDSDLEDIEQEYEKLQITEITSIPYDGETETKPSESLPALLPSSTTLPQSGVETDSASDSSSTTDSGVGKSDVEIVEIVEQAPAHEQQPPERDKDQSTNTITTTFKEDSVFVAHKESLSRNISGYLRPGEKAEEVTEVAKSRVPPSIANIPSDSSDSDTEECVSSDSNSEDTRVEFQSFVKYRESAESSRTKSDFDQQRTEDNIVIESINKRPSTTESMKERPREQTNSINVDAKMGGQGNSEKVGLRKKKSRIPTRRKPKANTPSTTEKGPKAKVTNYLKKPTLAHPSLTVTRSKRGRSPRSPRNKDSGAASASPRARNRISVPKVRSAQKSPSPRGKKSSAMKKKLGLLESSLVSSAENVSLAKQSTPLKNTRTSCSPRTKEEKTLASPRKRVKRKSTITRRPRRASVSINTDQVFRDSVQLVQLDGNLKASALAKPRSAEPFLWQFSKLPSYNGTASQYGMTQEQYELKKKRQEELKKKREEIKMKKKEKEEEKKRKNEDVFKAWLKQKQLNASTKSSLPFTQDVFDRKNNSEEAYFIWLRKKNEEKKLQQRIEELRRNTTRRINPTALLHRDYGSSPSLNRKSEDRLMERNSRTLAPHPSHATLNSYFGRTF